MSMQKAVSRTGATHITQFVALALVVGSYFLVRPEHASMSEKESLASRFKFERFDVSDLQFATGPLRTKHPLHPTLDSISAWVSCTGASVTLARAPTPRIPQPRKKHRRRLAKHTSRRRIRSARQQPNLRRPIGPRQAEQRPHREELSGTRPFTLSVLSHSVPSVIID